MSADRDAVVELVELRVVTASGPPILDAVSLDVRPGEVLGVVGESGSGKTTMALAMLGYARPGCQITGGTVSVCGEPMVGRTSRAVRSLRGRLISYVPQDPGGALNPSLRIGDQIHEMLRLHTPGRASVSVIEEALERVSLPYDRAFRRRFPHQLSGGQQQRVTLAMALAHQPTVVVLDEPTTGLDVVVQASIVRQLARLRDELGLAMVFVSHNLAVVSQLADRIAVMHDGSIVEQGSTNGVLRRPTDTYTRELIAAAAPAPAPTAASTPAAPARGPLLRVEDLRIAYRGPGGTVVAAQDVSFSIGSGQTVALVGESGSGKTSIGRAVAGLVEPDRGVIALDGEPLARRAARRTRDQLRRVQIVFQNPNESLNPRRTVLRSVARPAELLRGLDRTEAEREVRDLLERVRLPARLAERYPAELSGGERQRVAIARALAAQPELIVCDEITSALDVSVQAALLDLLGELRRSLGLALLVITHDLGLVEAVADHVIVLKGGLVRESGSPAKVLHAPSDDYTRELVAAAPRLELPTETPA